MRTHDVPGFVLRTDAVEQYGRSKASFIRDFDKAFVRGDTEFLNNFRLVLNDGSIIPGPEASKDKMQSLQAKQPWVYIKKSLLDSRYWEQRETNTTTKPKRAKQSGREEGSSPHRKLKGASDAVQLEHENAMLQRENESIRETVAILEKNNTFLQGELESRRGEIEGMTKFVDSVRLGIEAGKETAAEDEASGKQEHDDTASNVVEAVVVDDPEKGSSRTTDKSVMQKFMDFLNQPIGKDRKA